MGDVEGATAGRFFLPPAVIAPTSPAKEMEVESPSSPLRILVVDDDEAVRTLLAAALPRHGFSVYLADGGEEGVEVYRRHGESIDMVLTDVRMPGMDGPHTLAALRKLNPMVRCCFMTGSPVPYDAQALMALGTAHVFSKPFRDLDELARVLRQAACSGEE